MAIIHSLSPIFKNQVSGVGCSAAGGSAPPPGKKTAGLIEKETLKKRISNNECRMSK
jgi:hypothetical protein